MPKIPAKPPDAGDTDQRSEGLWVLAPVEICLTFGIRARAKLTHANTALPKD